MKAFYIYSYRTDIGYEAIEYDWFTDYDLDKYEDQEKLVAKYMVENEYAEDIKEALEKLENVYKQDTKVLLKQLGVK